MKEFSLEYLCCINCGSKLVLDILKEQKEIEEGFLECKNCNTLYPIIDKIPILWDAFGKYLANRRKLGGQLVNSVSKKMKDFVKNSLKENYGEFEDRTDLEERWTQIYQNSKQSRFYSVMKKHLKALPFSNLSVEYGCSIGNMSSIISDSSKISFGIDRSFSAIKLAKNNARDNLDYIVADSLSPIFGKTKFHLIVALNLLEIIEPLFFIKHISSQIQNGFLVITDPYDFDRGKNSVKKPLDESTLRLNLKNLGFKISHQTKNPSFIPWNLKLNPRARLNYKTDLVIAKKFD